MKCRLIEQVCHALLETACESCGDLQGPENSHKTKKARSKTQAVCLPAQGLGWTKSLPRGGRVTIPTGKGADNTRGNVKLGPKEHDPLSEDQGLVRCK